METMVITCPECSTKIKVPEAAIGKKIRCKSCEHVFVVTVPKKAPAPAEREGIKKPGATSRPGKSSEGPRAPKAADPPAPPKAPPIPVAGDADEAEGKSYGVADTDLTPRCPQCAAEMESEEAIICLNCGFNLKTREILARRKVKEMTGGDRFLWLLPGILCTLGIIIMISYWCYHHF